MLLALDENLLAVYTRLLGCSLSEDVELSSDVRLSPGGGLSNARVGDFRIRSLNNVPQSQGIRYFRHYSFAK